MPQLDKVTYCTQVVWLVIVFISLYLCIVLNFIPRLAFILKYRAKLDTQLNSSLYIYDSENNATTSTQTKEIALFTDELRSIFTHLNNDLQTWSINSIHSIKNKNLNNSTTLTIKTQASLPAVSNLLLTSVR